MNLSDQAITKWITEWCDLLLSDFGQFSDLHTMHLDHYGAAESGHIMSSGSTNPLEKPLIKKWNEPCRVWNKGRPRTS